MKCSICGGYVEWKGPLVNLTHTECVKCGGKNCQVPEEQEERERDEGVMLDNGGSDGEWVKLTPHPQTLATGSTSWDGVSVVWAQAFHAAITGQRWPCRCKAVCSSEKSSIECPAKWATVDD